MFSDNYGEIIATDFIVNETEKVSQRKRSKKEPAFFFPVYDTFLPV